MTTPAGGSAQGAGASTTARSVLVIEDLVAGYGGGDVLRGVSLEVTEGGITCVVGPNGAGKSTLMSSISGLLRPRLGSITLDGENLAGMSPRKLVFVHARLKAEIRVKTGLQRFLPAILSGEFENSCVELVPWQGSGDIAATARANCYIVIPPDCESIPAGEWAAVMMC